MEKRKIIKQFKDILSKKEPVSDIFKPLCELLFTNYQSFEMPEFIHCDIEKEQLHSEDNSIIVAFSGGLKSLAAVYYYLDRGYNVRIYISTAVVGNKTFEDALRSAISLCEEEELEFISDDSPVMPKYQLYNLNKINNLLRLLTTPCDVAVGSLSNVSLSSNDFKKYGSTCVELWQIYSEIFQYVDEEFYIHQPFPTYEQVFDVMWKHKSAFKYVADKKDKDFIYVVRADNDNTFEWSLHGYKMHLNKLINQYNVNTDNRYNRPENIWRELFFYDIRKSRTYTNLCK